MSEDVVETCYNCHAPFPVEQMALVDITADNSGKAFVCEQCWNAAKEFWTLKL